MKIDFGDVFATGAGFLVKQVFLILMAIWLGCSMAAVALVAASVLGAIFGGAFDADVFWYLLASPGLLLSVWLLPNIIFLGFMVCRLLIYSESTSLRTWGWLIGMEALFCLLSEGSSLFTRGEGGFAVLVFAGLITMLVCALKFLHGWQMNRWAGELVALQAENEMRRRELKEELGVESSGAEDFLTGPDGR